MNLSACWAPTFYKIKNSAEFLCRVTLVDFEREEMPTEWAELVCELYALLVEVNFIHYFNYSLVGFLGVLTWVLHKIIT